MSGVALRQPLDDATRAEIEEAWMQHQVLFFRDQPMSMDEHLAFALQFGEIYSHPVTGRKGLFVNETFTQSIEGMTDKESRALLGFLYEHIDSPEFHVRFHWTPDALAIWDNRCTQHRVVADRPEARRVMQRLTLAGDRPF